MLCVCLDQGGMLYGLGNWQKNVEEPPACQVLPWGASGIRLVSGIRIVHRLHTAQWDEEVLEHISIRKVKLTVVPEPGGWQGVCHQCWLEEGTWARAWTEVWAQLDAESTLNAKGQKTGKISWWQEYYLWKPSVGIDEKGVVGESSWQGEWQKKFLQQQQNKLNEQLPKQFVLTRLWDNSPM